MFKSLKWEDWLGVALGLWLVVSPWTLGHAESPAATMNALALGWVLIFLEQLNLDVHDDLEEGLDMVAGVWLMISPFVLGFGGAAAINAFAVGAVSVVLAAWALSGVDAKLAFWWRTHVKLG